MARHGNRRAPLSVWLATPVEWSGSALAETDGGGEEQAELGQPGHQQLRPASAGRASNSRSRAIEMGPMTASAAAVRLEARRSTLARASLLLGKKQLAGRGGRANVAARQANNAAGGGVVA